RIDGQVHGAAPGRADLGNRGLPDTGKAGDHDEVAGHAIFSEVVPTPAMKSSSGIVAGWSGTILSAVVNDLYSSGPASSPPRGSRNRRAYESERIPRTYPVPPTRVHTLRVRSAQPSLPAPPGTHRRKQDAPSWQDGTDRRHQGESPRERHHRRRRGTSSHRDQPGMAASAPPAVRVRHRRSDAPHPPHRGAWKSGCGEASSLHPLISMSR